MLRHHRPSAPEHPCFLTPDKKSRRAAVRRNRERFRRGGAFRFHRNRLFLALRSAAATALPGRRWLRSSQTTHQTIARGMPTQRIPRSGRRHRASEAVTLPACQKTRCGCGHFSSRSPAVGGGFGAKNKHKLERPGNARHQFHCSMIRIRCQLPLTARRHNHNDRPPTTAVLPLPALDQNRVETCTPATRVGSAFTVSTSLPSESSNSRRCATTVPA